MLYDRPSLQITHSLVIDPSSPVEPYNSCLLASANAAQHIVGLVLRIPLQSQYRCKGIY
jgi:hypothetical protein